ncbi:MAG: rhamnulokinase [Verrucomicrobia bacterium]|nr:rhamnulokinase [Verrucomicrobiota bacterium]
MSAKHMVAVDFGASGGKCFAGTLDNGTFSMHEIHRFPHEGVSFFLEDRAGKVVERTHWNDTLLYQNILLGLQAYRREVSDTLDSVGIDTWGADGQLMSADSELLSKVYCYRDHRLDTMIGEVKSRMDPERIYAITGIHFQPFNLSNQLLWLVMNRKCIFEEGAFFLPISSLFNYFLCGNKAVDSSWASVSQLMDAKTQQWSDEILKALGIPASILPPIIAPGVSLGPLRAPLARQLGLHQVNLIASASHDTASAFAAAPVDDPAEALIISSGTWSLVGKLIDTPITSKDAMQAGISNEGGIGNIRFLKNVMGTWLAQELRRGWQVEDGKETGWAELAQLASQSPSFVSLIDPDDARLFNPANMEAAIAACCRDAGEPVPQTRAAFLRCVYESLSFKYRFVNEQICAVSGTQTRVVHVVGGGCQNQLLTQFTANAVGRPVHAGPVEATAVGNFMVQALGLGAIASMSDAQTIIRSAFPIVTYEPNDAAKWTTVYPRFKSICTRKA